MKNISFFDLINVLLKVMSIIKNEERAYQKFYFISVLSYQYLESGWIHIYLDGSSLPGSCETGAGYFCKLFEGHIAVGALLGNYDGELVAVFETARQTLAGPTKAAFLIDSQASNKNLSNNKTAKPNAHEHFFQITI